MKTTSRVVHNAYGKGTVRKIDRNAITVAFDIGINTTVDLSNLAVIGSIPESMEVGEIVQYGFSQFRVDDVSVLASKIIATDTNGKIHTIPRYQDTIQRTRVDF